MKMLKAEDVQKRLDVGRNSAYVVIARLNSELEKQGYMTVKGRVPERYFLERFNLVEVGKK